MRPLVPSLVLVTLFAAPALATDPPPLPRMSEDVPLPAALRKVHRTAAGLSPAARADAFALHRVDVDERGRVLVVIVGPEGAPPVDEARLGAVGGEGASVWRHRRDAWVPPERLLELARSLPEGYRIDRARTWVGTDIPGEGPPVVRSDGYRDAGADGTGLTVAVIDGGFELLSDAIANGDAPAGYVGIDYSGHGLEADGAHGTGCVEAVYDHAPGAAYRIYKAWTDTHFPLAAEDAALHGVRVMSNSIAWLSAGWADDTGQGCIAANFAAANGILFCTSSGNFAEHHWQGTFRPDTAYPTWHDFDGTGDRHLDLSVTAGETVEVHLLWDNTGGGYDYDVYLFDGADSVLASSSAAGDTYEWFRWENDTGSWQHLYLSVVRVDSGLTEFEMFALGCQWLEHVVREGSSAAPANSSHPHVLSVGAVHYDNYDEPPGSADALEDYSSWGPSNGGTDVPDLVGPTGTRGVAFPAGMAGTSNSTPNVAGAIAAFWSAYPQFAPEAVRWLVLEQAEGLRDWGDPGRDDAYGRGGGRLTAFAPHTLWVARAMGNLANDPSLPFYSVAAAEAAAVPGGRLVFLGGSDYPETPILDVPRTLLGIGTGGAIGP